MKDLLKFKGAVVTDDNLNAVNRLNLGWGIWYAGNPRWLGCADRNFEVVLLLIEGNAPREPIRELVEAQGTARYWLLGNEPDGVWGTPRSQQQIRESLALQMSRINEFDSSPNFIVTLGSQLGFPQWPTSIWGAYQERLSDISGFHCHFYPEAAVGATERRWDVSLVTNQLMTVHQWLDARGAGDKELWLSEIGMPYSQDYARLTAYAQSLCTTLRDLAYCHRIAWFATVYRHVPDSPPEGGCLLNPENLAELTPLGITWSKMPQFFKDMEPEHWAYDAVQWAYRVGVAKGYGLQFEPEAPCTRAQVATFLKRFHALISEEHMW